MARGVNKAIIVGRLGADPEIKYTQSGIAVTKFNVATNESWLGKDGQREERTEWHRVVVWGKQAENCGQYLSKGRQVYIEGRLQTSNWEDKEGTKRYTTEIIAQNIQYLDSREGASSREGYGTKEYAPAVNPQEIPPEPSSEVEPESNEQPKTSGEDIPF